MNAASHSKIQDLEIVKQVFDKYKVDFLVVYGALLGFYRDKDFLPGDDDIDLAVIDKPDLKTRKAIGWSLYDLGFKPQQITFNVFGRMEPAEIGYNGDGETGIIVCERNIKFTIFFFKEVPCEQHGLEMLCVPKLGAVNLISSPAQFYRATDKIRIGRNLYYTPYRIPDYLAFTYGGWKDKTARNHGQCFPEMHAGGSLTREDANIATIWKS